MSVETYKSLRSEKYYSPSFSPLSTYSSTNVPIFSPRRNMNATARHRERRCISTGAIESPMRDRREFRLLREKSLFNGLTTAIFDSGKFVWQRLVRNACTGNGVANKSHDMATYLSNVSEKRREDSDQFQVPRKKRLIKIPELKDKDQDNPNEETSNKNNTTQILHFSSDPFNWSDWKTAKIEPTQAYDANDQPPQYGTSLIRRNRFGRKHVNNHQLTLRMQSDEANYLKMIYKGDYEVPSILKDERERQLKLLQGDRDSHLKKSIVDLTEKIKNILIEKSDLNKSNDELIIVRERKVSSLENKRREYRNQRLKFDRSLLQFDQEFKSYRQLLEERKEIQDQVRKKKESVKDKKLIPHIEQNDIENVKKTLERRDNAVLSNNDNLEVTVRDFKTLTPRRWLNDTIIEFFMKEIERKCQHVVAFNSFFYTTLSERGYQGVRRWMKRKKAQITDLEKIFVPINLNQSHWALGMIDLVRKRIVYVDSLSNGPNAMSFAILSDLQGYVMEESKNGLGSDFDLENLSCPQQPNGFDCGIYLCMNTLYLSHDAPLTFDQHDAVRMRTYIAHLILSK